MKHSNNHDNTIHANNNNHTICLSAVECGWRWENRIRSRWERRGVRVVGAGGGCCSGGSLE